MRSWRTHLPGPRADALLPQARLAGPMPWVIAIMVTLTVIAVAGGLALSNIVQQARSDLAGGLTVQIVNADPVGRAREAEVAWLPRLGEEGLAAATCCWLMPRRCAPSSTPSSPDEPQTRAPSSSSSSSRDFGCRATAMTKPAAVMSAARLHHSVAALRSKKSR